MAFLPPYAPDLNLVKYLWAWLKRHALVNYSQGTIAELASTAHGKLKSAQRRGVLRLLLLFGNRLVLMSPANLDYSVHCRRSQAFT